jgi:predicted AlkP superfamily pyrophosphatase or phosphodiesterase
MKAVLALLLVAACSAPAAAPTVPGHGPVPDSGMKLVVLVVIDQWPEWAFETKRPELHGGFERLLAEGEWHVGRYPSAATLTGPDHALLGTGEPPARSGILSDEWWHPDPGVLLEAVHAEDGTISAKWLTAPGLGDALAAAHGGKAVDVSLKPRAAILPLGRHGLSIWFDLARTEWTSLTPPAWLAAWNTAHPLSEHVHDVWTPLDAAHLATIAGVPDDDPGEHGGGGFGPTFPHDPQTTKDPAHSLLATPVGNDIVLDTATHAIEAEQLGKHARTDLLVVSLSTHDYVGHGWGQESWEMWDLTLRLDHRLDQMLGDLDRLVGPGKWAMVVTADHGASPLPEKARGGRLTPEQILTAANNAATAVLGDGRWIDDAHYPYLYFSKAMLAQPRGELESATKHVINALRAIPGLERVDRTADLAGHCDSRTGDDRAICLMLDPVRSGELFYLPASGWILQSENEPAATAHGSLHDYDQLVPVIVLAPDRERHAPETAPRSGELAMTDIAPMLAGWLGIPPPNAQRVRSR